MTKALPFTEAKIERAIRGARAAGLEIGAVAIAPDGTVVIYGPVETEKIGLTGKPRLRDAREKLRDG
jgi:hypothetical protein